MITRGGRWKTKQKKDKNPAGQLLSPLCHLLPYKPSRQLISSVKQNSTEPIPKCSATEGFQSRADWPSPHFDFCVTLLSAVQEHLQLVKGTTALNTAYSADPTANEHLARKTIQFLLFV